MTNYILPETIDRAAAADAAIALSGLIEAGAKVSLDGSAVKQIGQAGLQLLLSSFATAQSRNAAISLVEPSDALKAAVTLTGTQSLLGC